MKIVNMALTSMWISESNIPVITAQGAHSKVAISTLFFIFSTTNKFEVVQGDYGGLVVVYL
jgi:hypothetical protein